MLRAIAALSLALPCLAFTAQDMLSAPRPQAPILSPGKDLALNIVDEWDAKTDHMSRTLYLLNLTSVSEPTKVLTSTPAHLASPFWLSSDRFAYLNSTTLLDTALNGTSIEILTFPFSPSDLQLHEKSETLYFTAQIWEGSGLEDVERGDKAYMERGYEAEVFDELFIRHWDTWRIPGKVWTVGSVHLPTKRYRDMFGSSAFHKFYQKMDAPAYTLSETHMAITVKPAHLNDALHTRTDIYVIPLINSDARLITPHAHGAISSVTFDKTGHKIAWLEMAEDGYEAVQNKVRCRSSKSGKWDDIVDERVKSWYRSPTVIEFSDSVGLLLLAEWYGRNRAYALIDRFWEVPFAINGSISSIKQVSEDAVLVTASSFASPANSWMLNTTSGDARQLTEWTKPMSKVQAGELWFKGADGRDVMAWVMRPTRDVQRKDGKVPMAFLIHGGPQGAWEDTWSTRWNPALFAEKGYFVVAVNPTGSTGYGQDFTDRIQSEWGGRPFKDLLAGYHAALKTFPEIDPERTAALGASYGGYMANWIQGHNDQFGFKAIVCHDGIFDTSTSYYTTEEVWFPNHEFGGDMVSSSAMYQKWNPMNHVSEWSTPELVIHGGKDYRLVASQGIAAFTALQTRGVPSRFLYFPNENHWVLSPRNSMKWHHEVFRWLAEWVGVEGPEGVEERVQISGAGRLKDQSGQLVL